MAFSDAEAVTLALAVAAQPTLPFAADARSALVKLLRAVPLEQRRRARDLAGRLWLRDPTGDRPTLAPFDEALRRRVLVHLDYTDAGGATTRRRPVEPLALARTHGSWWLVAWCRRADGVRWFRLDRVGRADLDTERIPDRDLLEVVGEPPPDARAVSLPEEQQAPQPPPASRPDGRRSGPRAARSTSGSPAAAASVRS